MNYGFAETFRSSALLLVLTNVVPGRIQSRVHGSQTSSDPTHTPDPAPVSFLSVSRRGLVSCGRPVVFIAIPRKKEPTTQV